MKLIQAVYPLRPCRFILGAAAGLALIVGPLTGIGLGKIDLTIVYLVGACLDLVNMAFTWKYYPDTSAISTYRRLHTESDEEDDVGILAADGPDSSSAADGLLNRDVSGSSIDAAAESSQRGKRRANGDAMDHERDHDDDLAAPISREFPGFLELFRTSNPLSVMRILLETPFLMRLSFCTFTCPTYVLLNRSRCVVTSRPPQAVQLPAVLLGGLI